MDFGETGKQIKACRAAADSPASGLPIQCWTN